MTADKNPGVDAPIPKCGRTCGALMDAFDQLPRPLRDFFNDEVRISWCMCAVLRLYRARGATQVLVTYRELERRYK